MSRVSLKNTFLDFKDEHDEESAIYCRRQRSRSQDVTPARTLDLGKLEAEAREQEKDEGDWSPSLLARYTEVLKNPVSPLTSPALGIRASPSFPDMSPSRLDVDEGLGWPQESRQLKHFRHNSECSTSTQASDLHSTDAGYRERALSEPQHGESEGADALRAECAALRRQLASKEEMIRQLSKEMVPSSEGNDTDDLEMVMNIEEQWMPGAPPGKWMPAAPSRPSNGNGFGPRNFTALHSVSSCPSMASLLEESSMQDDEDYQAFPSVSSNIVKPLHAVNSCPSMGSLLEEGDTETASPYQASPPTDGPYAPQKTPLALLRGRQQADNDDMRTREDALSPGGRNALDGALSSSTPGQYRHNHVPKSKNLVEQYGNKKNSSQPITTLMIRNIPNRYSQRDLIEEMEELGFGGTYDFLYLPMDKGTLSNVGYAFVNFVDGSWSERGMDVFTTYRFKRYRKQSGKIATVSVAHIQGLKNNLKHYQNTAVKDAREKQHRPMVIPSIQRALQVGTLAAAEGSIDDL